MEEKEFNLQNVLTSIMTSNVNISEEEYKKMIDGVAGNYDKIKKDNGEENETQTPPTLEERRERIKANYYGTCVNMLFSILHSVNEFHKTYAPLMEAIAEKVGVEFEKVKTEEEKAMEAAAEYLRESAAKKRAEKELLEKQNLNREQRRKVKKETGEVIKFKKPEE